MAAAPFPEQLAAVLKRKQWSQRAFAARIGVTQAFVSHLLAGRRRPPLDDLDRWMRVLHLGTDDADALRLAAHLAHASPWLRALVLRLLEEEAQSQRPSGSRLRVAEPGPEWG